MPCRLRVAVAYALLAGLYGQAVVAQEARNEDQAAAACAGGVIKDDGSVDSGYGFVPSAQLGIYLQAFDRKEFPHPYLEAVCVCWLKTRGGRDIDFEVVVYDAVGGQPAAEPRVAVAAEARGVAESVAAAGAFERVEMGGAPLPAGPFFLGVRWNPKEQAFLFLCVDRSAETAKVPVVFREDRAPRFTPVALSRDPIFAPHRAVMVRALSTARPRPVEPVPAAPLASAPPRSNAP